MCNCFGQTEIVETRKSVNSDRVLLASESIRAILIALHNDEDLTRSFTLVVSELFYD